MRRHRAETCPSVSEQGGPLCPPALCETQPDPGRESTEQSRSDTEVTATAFLFPPPAYSGLNMTSSHMYVFYFRSQKKKGVKKLVEEEVVPIATVSYVEEQGGRDTLHGKETWLLIL